MIMWVAIDRGQSSPAAPSARNEEERRAFHSGGATQYFPPAHHSSKKREREDGGTKCRAAAMRQGEIPTNLDSLPCGKEQYNNTVHKSIPLNPKR